MQNDANNSKYVCIICSYICRTDICYAFYILYVYGLRMHLPRMDGNENHVDTPALEQDY